MAEDNEYLSIEAEIVSMLKTVYDPEIPVNIYELGLIYEIDVDEYNNVDIKMTLTAPGCPVADSILMEVTEKVRSIELVNRVDVQLVFDPPWAKEMMSEEAMLQLGFM